MLNPGWKKEARNCKGKRFNIRIAEGSFSGSSVKEVGYSVKG